MDKCRHQFMKEEDAELEKYRDKQKDKRLPSDSLPFLCSLK